MQPINVLNNLSGKKRITHSYFFFCSPNDLFFALHNPIHLQNWFAERVDYNAVKKVYTFSWHGFEDAAKLTYLDPRKMKMRLEWIGKDHVLGETLTFSVLPMDDDGAVELVIEDYCDVGDEKNFRQMWDENLHNLSRML
jgi:hypothetical protein